MAQGSGRVKKRRTKIGLKSKGPSRASSASGKRRNTPQKQKRRLRDKKITKLLHRNIENLMAAKVLKNDGRLTLTDIKSRGKEQLKVMDKTKKRKHKSKAEAMTKQLQTASDRLCGIKKKRKNKPR